MAHKHQKSGRPPKYPWKKWLSGKKFVLTRGIDFQCESYVFVLQARRAAKPLGVKVHALVNEGTVHLSTRKVA
jgi:hypothetical protein